MFRRKFKITITHNSISDEPPYFSLIIHRINAMNFIVMKDVLHFITLNLVTEMTDFFGNGPVYKAGNEC